MSLGLTLLQHLQIFYSILFSSSKNAGETELQHGTPGAQYSVPL
jgi:hypothetical protein